MTGGELYQSTVNIWVSFRLVSASLNRSPFHAKAQIDVSASGAHVRAGYGNYRAVVELVLLGVSDDSAR